MHDRPTDEAPSRCGQAAGRTAWRTVLRASLLAALGLLGPCPTARADDPDHVLTIGDAMSLPGSNVDLHVRLTFDGVPLQGWSWGIQHDPAFLDLVSAGGGVTTATVKNGGPPDFEEYGLFAEGWTAGVVVCFLACATLPPGTDLDLGVATYDLVGPQGATSLVCFSDSLGAPPVLTEVVALGEPIFPHRFCGTVVLQEMTFVRGDCNDDGTLDIADGIWLLSYLFAFGPGSNCFSACDANDDGSLDIGDPLTIFNYALSGGPPPAPPFPQCGTTPTATCAGPTVCSTAGCDPQALADTIVAELLPGADPLDPLTPHVYVRSLPLSSGDTVRTGDHAASTDYVAEAGDCVAWIDDHPASRFEHPSRVVIAREVAGEPVITEVLPTSLPVFVNDVPLWTEVGSNLGPDFYFPDVTHWDVLDVDASPIAIGVPPTGGFSGHGLATSLTLLGNVEESNDSDTEREIDETIAPMGIATIHQLRHAYLRGTTPTGAVLLAELQQAFADAAGLSVGSDMVVFLGAHGFPGGVLFDKTDPETAVTHEELLCALCAGLAGSSKSRVLIIADIPFAGTLADCLAAFDPDCDGDGTSDCPGLSVGILAGCGATEFAHASTGVLLQGAAWDFLEELEDEDWNVASDLFELALQNLAGAAAHMDHADQNPLWSERVLP